MSNITFERTKLAKGEINLYDFGGIKLHAYKTNDPIDDEVFVIERGGNAVIIESPCFFDNNRELESYLADKKLNIAGMLLAYHMGGGTFLPQARKYATKKADEYGHTGGGKALIDNFSNIFSKTFDNSIHNTSVYIGAGVVEIGGIKFIIIETPDAFDIEIPEINAIYTHMLGHDCHSIVAGAGHADAIMNQLKEYLDKGYGLILTSHYTPEELKDVETKIEYIQSLKNIAERCADAPEFKAAVKKLYPDYSGDNYLDMTAGFFFPDRP